LGASIISITVSSIVAIAVIGYALLRILGESKVLEPLRAK
jgi:hypothetical protein